MVENHPPKTPFRAKNVQDCTCENWIFSTLLAWFSIKCNCALEIGFLKLFCVDFKVSSQVVAKFLAKPFKSSWQVWQHVKSSIVGARSLGLRFTPPRPCWVVVVEVHILSLLFLVCPLNEMPTNVRDASRQAGKHRVHNNLLIENSLKETLKMGIGKCNGYSSSRRRRWTGGSWAAKNDEEFLSLLR